MIKELIRFIFLLFITSVIMFSIVHFSPSANVLYSNKEGNNRWIRDYANWLKGIVKLDMGKTSRGEPILKEIMSKAKNSAFLIALALTISITWTLLFLIISFNIKERLWLYSVRSIFYTISVFPLFILGYFFLHISHHKLVSPQTSLQDPSWVYYLIPALILGVGDGVLSKFIRYAQVEIDAIKNENYLRMAIAKGARLWHHLKNDFIIHMSKIISLHLVILISGTVIIEYIFCLPGIGSLAFNAAENRDVRLLLGILILIVVIVTLFNFINRLVAITIDPRLREG